MSNTASDYLWRLYVPAEKLSFTVAEALEAMGRAMHPDPNPTAPVMIREARKVPLGANPSRAHSLPLDEADWDLLRLIWSRLDAPSFPMSESAWKAYTDAFGASRNRPTEWTLTAIQQDPELQTELRRAFSDDAHRRDLQEKVGIGAIRVRNPLTGDDADLLWHPDQDDWLLSRQQFKVLCNSRSIEFLELNEPVAKFFAVARPLSVPSKLLQLPSDARISVVWRIGRKNAETNAYSAGEFRDDIEATIKRQSEGFFTVDEAAQILADERFGETATNWVRDMRTAHRAGVLAIRDYRSRIPFMPARRSQNADIPPLWTAEQDRERGWKDLVRDADMDAWLQKTAGYRFSNLGEFSTDSEGVPKLLPAVQSVETPQARRARRAARFQKLGGEMRSAGTGWQCSGKRGALAAVVREEAAAGRPMSDKSDVRDDLIASMGEQRGS